MSQFEGKTLLVTGATGSFGQAFIKHILSQESLPEKLICFSRDELKQFYLREEYPEHPEVIMRYFLGDIRDRERLLRAFNGVDIIIHAAALKQVSTGLYNPLEMAKTNVMGTSNVIEAAIDNNVDKIILLSTDKAVEPKNLYGMCKGVAEGLFLSANAYVGAGDSKFSVVRYGNIWGSRGGVIDLWAREAPRGLINLTVPYATRFIIHLEDAVNFVISSLTNMNGREIFIPQKLPSVSMEIVAKAFQEIYDCEIKEIPIRQGDKIHETLEAGYTSDKARRLTKKEIKSLINHK